MDINDKTTHENKEELNGTQDEATQQANQDGAYSFPRLQ